MTRAHAAPMLIVRSIFSPSPSSSDVGSSLGRAGIAGEVIVFKGTSDPVLGHAIGKSGDTESDVGGGGTVLVLG